MHAICPRIQRLLEESLDVSISLQGADKGKIQLLDETGTLRIVAQRGFQPDFLEYFKEVRPGDGAPCGRAVAEAKPVAIADLFEDAAFAPHCAIARSAGIRAIQCTPLFTAGGDVLGALSLLYGSSLPSPEWRMEFLHASAIRTAAIFDGRCPPKNSDQGSEP